MATVTDHHQVARYRAGMEDKLVFTFLGLLAAIATAGVLGIVMDDFGFDFVIIRANALTSAGLIGMGLAGNVLLTLE